MNIELLKNYLEARFVKSEINIKIMDYIIHLAYTGVYANWWVISLSSWINSGAGSLVFYTHKNTILNIEDIIIKMAMEDLRDKELTDDGRNTFIRDVMPLLLSAEDGGGKSLLSSIMMLDKSGVSMEDINLVLDLDDDTSNPDAWHDESIFKMTDPESPINVTNSVSLVPRAMPTERMDVLVQYLTDRGIDSKGHNTVMEIVKTSNCADWYVREDYSLLILIDQLAAILEVIRIKDTEVSIFMHHDPGFDFIEYLKS